jgi:hypothetical protein
MTKQNHKYHFFIASYFAAIKQCVLLIITTTMTCVAYSNPVLDNVAAGNVSVTQSPTTTVVNQTSQQAIINWNSFNIAAGEKTQFVQPNVSSIALNRINPAQGASQIYGSLSSNGQIILVNGAGIHFGPSAMVNVGGMIATTSDISNANFLAGNYTFDIPSAYHGSIINEGTLIAANHGLIALLGTNVQNNGMIQAEMGSIVMGAGNVFTLDFYGDQLINFTVDQPATTGGTIKNTGSLLADGGKILVTAQAAQGVLDSAIDMQGIAQAQSVDQQNGEIILSSDANVNVSGTLDASGLSAGSLGGTIKVLGNNILLTSSANLNASGDAGGGEILVGGNAHGAGPEQNALTTTVANGATLAANAMTLGNGGKVVVWSNADTEFHGSISAQGGSQSGNGGAVETSGEYLDISNAQVNLLAANGVTGDWLLDPSNVTIQSNSGTDSGEAYSSPNYTPTSGSATSIIDVTNLVNALNSSNVTITTTNNGSSGGSAGTITVASPITWYNVSTLTLNAASTITINAAITAPAGGLTLNAANTAQSITTGASGAVNVNNFTLAQGQWYQNGATLPSFTATNNFSLAAGTQFLRVAGGAGSSGSPYQLTDIYGLQGAATLSLGNSYILNNNIDATVTANWNNGLGFVPIAAFSSALVNTGSQTYSSGDNANTFSGSFNGNYFTINNLYINNPAYTFTGLFGIVHSSAATVIQNLGLTNANITGTSQTAGIAALISGTGSNILLNNVYVTGAVTGGGATGGLVGSIDGFNNSGYGGTIQNSYNAATITLIASGFAAAGIAGNISIGSVLNSYNIGTINAGGNGATIGGITGDICSGCNGGVSIQNNYNSGKIATNGFSGVRAGAIGGDTNDMGPSGNFFDTNTSGVTVSAGDQTLNPNAVATGLTTANMMNISNFSSAGWSITSSSSTSPNSTTWYIAPGAGATRPILISEEFSGNTAEPINNGHQLELINANLAGTYTLAGNVNLSNITNVGDIWGTTSSLGAGFSPIGGTSSFTGTFNGNYYDINNLYISSSLTRSTGFFSNIGGNAQVNNVSFFNANVTNLQSVDLGIIAGFANGNATFTNDFTSGKITGTTGNTGGFFGQTDGANFIYQSANFANVTGTGFVGGFDGYSRLSIYNSYNTGTITGATGTGAEGGFVGYGNSSSGATYNNSYNSGYVTGHNAGAIEGAGQSQGGLTLQNIYFDSQSSGATQAIGNGGSVNGTAIAGTFTGSSGVNLSTIYNSSTNTNGAYNSWNIASSSSTTPNSAIWFLIAGSTRPMLISEEFMGNNPLTIQNAHQLQLIDANLSANYTVGNNIDLSSAKNSNSDIWGGTLANSGSGFGFVPLGNSASNFTGSFNGGNYVINNLYINNTSLIGAGLFGYINSSNTIKNVGITNANITAEYTIGGLVGSETGATIFNTYSTGTFVGTNPVSNTGVGGLIGYMSGGTLANSYSNSSITSHSDSGGLVADAFNNAKITNSFSLGNITGYSTAGGLVGYSANSDVSNSYSLASVTEASIGAASGLVAAQSGTVENSYSAGLITNAGGSSTIGGLFAALSGSVTNSYWDTTTSGQSSSAGGTGETTAQLQAGLPSVFSTNTWGIIAGNGTTANGSYPYLLNFYSTTPTVVSGFAPGGSALATGLGGSTIQLAVNGSTVTNSGQTLGSVTTGANGFYYFLEPKGIIANNNPLLTYLSGVASAITDAPASGNVTSGLNMTTNTVSVGDSATKTITNANLVTAAGAIASTLTLFTASGTAPTAVVAINSGENFLTQAATTYTLDGTISTSGGGTLTFNGPTILGNAGTVNSASGLVTFANTVTGNGQSLSLNSAGNSTGSFVFNGAVTLGNLITSAQGYAVSLLGSSTDTISSATLFRNTGGVTLGAGNTINFTNGVTSTTGTTTANATIVNGTINATNSNITLGTGIINGTTALNSGTGTISFGALTGTGNLTLTSSSPMTISSTINIGSLTFATGGNDTINTSNIITSGNQTYNNAITLGAASTWQTTTAAGNITINAPVTWSNTNLLTLNSANNITLASNGLNPIINATGGGSLTLVAANQINLNGGINLTGGAPTSNGNLTISATSPSTVITPAAAIAGTQMGGAVNVNNFNLTEGKWNQINSNLANFNVNNNFQILSGALSTANGNAAFIRALSGDGSSSNNAYLITDVYGLQGIAYSTGLINSYYTLNNDINASSTANWNNGSGFISIGTGTTFVGDVVNNFNGYFNGQDPTTHINHVVNQLYISQPNTGYIGLFGTVGYSGTVTNVGVTGAMSGNARTGGLAGLNEGAISNSFSNSTVTGTGPYDIGGLVGRSDGTISNSFSSGTVTETSAYYSVGGLVGYSGGNITNSYSLANVIGTNNPGSGLIGGLVGENHAGISNSYAAGYITTNGSNNFNQGGLIGTNHGPGPVNSYWDMQTTGQNNSGGGTGETSATLQAGLQSGFSSATWGIIAGNGLSANGSYPYLLNFYTSTGTPSVISGFAPTNSTVQIATNGTNITTAGLAQGTTATGNNGFYYFLEPTLTAGSAILTYLTSGGLANAVTVSPTSSTVVSGLNMTANAVSLGDASINTLTNTNLVNAYTNAAGANILYSISGNNLILGNSTNNTAGFITEGTTTYGLGGNISDYNTNNSGSIQFNGLVTLAANSTIQTNNGGSITIGNASNGTGGITWNAGTNSTLNLNSASNITINAPINAVNGGATGSLNLSAANSTNDITTATSTIGSQTTTGGAINVYNFNLLQGQWYQDAASNILPNFTVANNFQILSGASSANNASAQFIRAVGGNGSSTPYLLTDVYGLQGVAYTAASSFNTNFSLNNSIAAASTNLWNNGAGFVSIASGAGFSGTFNGQNNYINNFYMNNITLGTNIGLFGLLNSNGTIENLNTSGTVLLTGSFYQFQNGGLVGTSSGTIKNASFNGTVSGGYGRAGLLVGDVLGGTISDSYAIGSLTASAQNGIGGFVGVNNGGTISDSYAIVNVNSTGPASGVGGFIGNNNSGTITRDFSAGTVTGTGNTLGGFAGNNGGTISNSFWDTDSTGLSTGLGSGSASNLRGGCFNGTCANGGTVNLSLQSTYSASGWTFNSTTWGIINGQSYPYIASIYTSAPRAISGYATNAGSGVANTAVSLEVNGANLTTQNGTQGSALTGANGFYYLLEASGAIADTFNSNPSVIVPYLATSNGGATVTEAASNGGSTTNLNITKNTLTVGDSNTNNFSNNFLSTEQTDPNLSSYFSVVSNNLILNNGIGLTTGSGTTYTINGTITGPLATSVSNNLNFLGGVTLGMTTALNAGTNNIYFGSTINGAYDLSLISAANTLNGALNIASLTTTGSTTIKSNVTTTNSQIYNNAVALSGNANLQSTGNGSISFNSTVNANNHTLGIATGIASGVITFTSTLSNLASLVTTAYNTVINNSGISTTGAQTYNSAVTLGANTSFNSSANGNIAFGSTVSGGANNISINTGGTTTFLGAISNVVTFISSAATTAINGGSVNSTGSQTYNGSVTAANDVQFNATAIYLNGGSVNSTGSQTYNAPVTLGADTTLTTSANVTANNGISGASKNLTVNGNTGNNIFTFIGNLVLNNISVSGSTLGNNTLSVQSSNPQTWIFSGMNAGSIMGAGSNQFNFNGIGNVVGSSNNNTFTLSGGTLTGSITGSGSNNTLTAGNGNTTFNITGTNSGSATGITSFSNIQNLTGGSNYNTFMLSGGTLTGSITGGGSNNTLAAGNSNTTFNITGTNTGLATGIASFSNIQNLTGGSAYNTFMLSGGTLTGSITGVGSNNTLAAGNGNTTFNITGTNSGLATGIASFSNIQNLIGGSSYNTFMLNGGTLTGTITGGGSNNTLIAGNGNNTFNITGTNSGSVSGINGFTNIQNLTGGSGNNMFNFMGNASLSGALNGGGNATNTLNYTNYSPITITLQLDHSGLAQNIGSGFQNINNLIGSGMDTLTVANSSKTNVIHITGALQGYVNDPTNFTGFNTFTSAGGVNTQVVFDTNASYNVTNNTAVVNGAMLNFVNMQNFSGNITAQVNATQTSAITSSVNASTTAAAAKTSVSGSTDAALQASVQITNNVNNNITNLTNSQAQNDVQISNDQKVTTNCS